MFGDYGNHMFGGYGMGGGMIFMLLFLVLIVVGASYLFKLTVDKGNSPPPAESAEDILKKRYARGDINQAEFEKIKKDLQD